MHAPSAKRGILLMIAGSSIFSTNDAFSKLALEHIPPSQILAVRGVMAALFLIAVLGWKGQLPALRFVADWRVMARAVAEACVAMLFITAITKMSIADATAILQVTPLATMVVAVLFFGARIGWRQWLAVAVGFAGVMLIVKPASSAFDAMALLPLGAALLMAFRDFITGRIGAHVPTLVVTFGTTVVGMGFGFAGSSVEPWHGIDAATFGYLVAGSVSLVVGHMLTIAAFRAADTALVSPFRYAAVVCAVGLSALLFHDMPDLISICGMALIMAAGLYTMHHHMSAPKVTPAARLASGG
ncbi:DMT family transporter [Ancylobacter dichloromethanicus]|uniref:Membrane protein n=1 Tax=Ancylobacter dichloromethanicus TaxID=518825 RepID=A0A9W6MXW2_9HYPH|nr:DMT family transporter [Ancylobacter dichloromethanicus]MBS7553009.1 DMT family transporter [Ancylobacter dichloromethanicus]GLK70330.1 membrane protein [Ancylobacter dichloromethanicus]